MGTPGTNLKGNPNWAIMAYIAADDVLSDFAVGSLQQLKSLAGEDTVVAAQFDANGKQAILRLIFDGKENQGKSIHDGNPAKIAPVNMAEPEALREFINWAYEQHKAKHYCLVLWGHGPELLTGGAELVDGQRAKKFLTPSDVCRALAGTTLISKDHCKFDIVAIDACNMGMLEMACELGNFADFMVASQEEVPDFSFPYDKLLKLGSAKLPEEILKVCREIPSRYIEAYRDYILTQATQTKSITLSSLSVHESGAVTALLRDLVDAFKAADEATRQVIIDARAKSKDFVFGLYVDVADFCQQLNTLLFRKNIAPGIQSICDQLCKAMQPDRENPFILANEVAEDIVSTEPQNRRCHGISVYFPYVTYSPNKPAGENSRGIRTRDGSETGNRSYDEGVKGLRELPNSAGADVPAQRGMTSVSRGGPDVLSKGGPDVRTRGGLDVLSKGGLDVLSKGGLDVLSKGGLDVLSKMRRQRIEETEQYYADLEFSKETQWDKFIRHHWCRWLLENVEAILKESSDADVSDVLNQQYSAQQCAFNLLSLCREHEASGNPGNTRAGNENDRNNGTQHRSDPVDSVRYR